MCKTVAVHFNKVIRAIINIQRIVTTTIITQTFTDNPTYDIIRLSDNQQPRNFVLQLDTRSVRKAGRIAASVAKDLHIYECSSL